MKLSIMHVLLAVAVSACDYVANSTYSTGKSSSGYQVRLRGDLSGKPNAEFTSNVVLFELMSPAQRPALELHRADKRDFPFRSEYPTETWIRGNILRFESNYGKGLNAVPVHVRNNSKTTIEALRIKFGDLFLVFDLPPGHQCSFDSPVSAFVEVLGRFVEGEVIQQQHVQSELDSASQIKGLVIVIGESGTTAFEWK
jgi:hypothetical protein